MPVITETRSNINASPRNTANDTLNGVNINGDPLPFGIRDYTHSELRAIVNTANIARRSTNRPLIDSTSYPSIFDKQGMRDNLTKFNLDIQRMNNAMNADTVAMTGRALFRKNNYEYNRFKLPFANSALQHTTSHVFITRPNCNILMPSGGNGYIQLSDSARYNANMVSAFYRNREILRNLSRVDPPNEASMPSGFSMLLSNAAASFQLKDEYITTAAEAKTLDGHSIAYGKLNTESKAMGDFTIQFVDDRQLNIYQCIKIWVDYISAVYIGEMEPTYETIIARELDYAASLYYILTAEDGETILFWSKYYGVFPKSIPSNQYSWTRGNSLSMPELGVEFQYSFKEDYALDTIREFNTDAFNGEAFEPESIHFEPVYNTGLGEMGSTWVTTPYIDVVKSRSDGRELDYKLRFYKKS